MRNCSLFGLMYHVGLMELSMNICVDQEEQGDVYGVEVVFIWLKVPK
jgi:hypothetical protein